ncbi:MAG TPA: glycosyltransferase, partial [bacterium]|nr:glycosyltransferase [bacterium]
CIDKFSVASSGRKKKVIEENEKRLIKKVDLILTITSHLKKYLCSITNKEIHLIFNGAQIEEIFEELSKEEKIPDEIKNIPEPRLGFMGTLNAKVDINLIYKIALQKPNYHWIFIGLIEEEELDKNILNKLKVMNNIHLLGPKNRQEILKYERFFNFCTIPLLINEWTKIVLPLKFFEYLALGLPIISTPLPELAPFNDLIFFGKNENEWINKIDYLLNNHRIINDLKIKEQKKASEFSWKTNAEKISEIINKSIKK